MKLGFEVTVTSGQVSKAYTVKLHQINPEDIILAFNIEGDCSQIVIDYLVEEQVQTVKNFLIRVLNFLEDNGWLHYYKSEGNTEEEFSMSVPEAFKEIALGHSGLSYIPEYCKRAEPEEILDEWRVFLSESGQRLDWVKMDQLPRFLLPSGNEICQWNSLFLGADGRFKMLQI